MNRAVILLPLVLALLAGCASAPRRPDGPRPALVTPLGLEPPPIYALLGFRDDIHLTSEQINALDSIAIATRDENGPLISALRDSSRVPRDRAGIIVPSEQRALLDRIQTNNQEAKDAVAELLTPTQETAVCSVFEEARQERLDKLHGAVTRGSRRRPSQVSDAEADSILSMGVAVWPWCGDSGNGADSTSVGGQGSAAP